MTKIRGGVIGPPDSRSEDKVFGILSENFPGKFVTNIVRETNPATFLFIGSGGKVGRGFVRVNTVVDRFPERKMEQQTDVWSLSCQGLEWREAIQGRRGHVVEEDTDILETAKPGRWRAAIGTHVLVDPSLGSSPSILSLVLVLMIGFRLVISNKELSEEVSDLLGDFIGASITDKGMHGSPVPDIISQGVDELLGTLDAICITDQGFSATE